MRYCCGWCNRQYDKIEDATACEATGRGVRLPKGLLYGTAHRPSGKYSMTFAVASHGGLWHSTLHGAWACRDTPASDNLEGLCQGPQTWPEKPGLYPGEAADPAHPTFQRMAAHVREQGLIPSYWDGEKIVPVALTPGQPEGEGHASTGNDSRGECQGSPAA